MGKFKVKMKYKINPFQPILIFILVLNMFSANELFSQTTGSLFMFQDNFHAQMINPSYMRNDKAIVVAVPGFAGFSFGNSSNFKITDLLTSQGGDKMIVDFEHFYTTGNVSSSIGQWVSVPVFYVGVPVNEGMISVYYKEQMNSSLNFNTHLLEFLEYGNLEENYRSYTTGEINMFALGYREFAMGYARILNEKIHIGLRVKFLFGAAIADLNKWSYGIKTSETGDEVELSSSGSGRLSLPVPMLLNTKERIQYINGEGAIVKYLSNYHNPGFALDFGATIALDENNLVSLSANDLGGIWFRQNTRNIEQKASYIFKGFELTNAIDNKTGREYVDPFYLVKNTKDSIRNIYYPHADTSRFVKGLAPKIALHYQNKISEFLSFGVTNQSSLQKNYFLNILSFSSAQSKGNLTLFENINLYNFKCITFGGGVQWENRFAQLFVATDNLLAIYHPANQKSFSLTLGISLLLNKPVNKEPNGEISPYFPFYKIR